MAESPTPPEQRSRALALGALLAAFVGVLIAVVAALGSGDDRSDPLAADRPAATRTAERPATTTEKTTATTGTTTTAAVAGPARDMGSPGPARPVPILLYQVVNDPPPGAPDPDRYVPKDEFADQMQALDEAGYTAVTLREWWDSWNEDGPLPAKPVVVSFDDGYHSHLANALPVLRELGWPGVLNLALENIRSDYGLTGAQVRALVDAGWELDSRTVDGPDLTTLDAAELQREVADSRAELKRRFGVPADFFCYPAGRYDEAVIAAVRAAGYLGATTEEPGSAQPDDADRWTLPRVRVSGGVSGETLVAQLDALD